MQDVLPLVRKSVLSSLEENSSSGMPGESGFDPAVIQLDTNLNFFSHSSYINYPVLNQELLFNKYFQYLQSEYKEKNLSVKSLSFLTPNHCIFRASAEMIDLVVRTFCSEFTNKVLICSPTFPYYKARVKLNGCQIIDIPLLGENFTLLDEERILKEKFNIMYLPVPNNPVGSITNKQSILNILNNSNSIVVIDEAYAEFSDEESWVDEIPNYPQLIVIRSFSKFWGMPGVRAGVTFAQPTVIQYLKEMAVPFGLAGPVIAELLKQLEDYQTKIPIRTLIKNERDFLIVNLIKLKIIEKIYPCQTNFIMCIVHNAKHIHAQLVSHGILTRLIDPVVSNAIRITIGDRSVNLKLLQTLSRLNQESIDHHENQLA